MFQTRKKKLRFIIGFKFDNYPLPAFLPPFFTKRKKTMNFWWTWCILLIFWQCALGAEVKELSGSDFEVITKQGLW